jgi:UDP-galactopyranose mutase
MHKPILILGAGLAGLSAAYHLKQDCLVLEKEAEAGGLCRSFHADGFTFDYAPHILYPQDNYTRMLVKKLLAGNLRTQEREAWIYHRKYRAYTRFPFQSHLYGLPPIVRDTCLASFKAAHTHDRKRSPRTYAEWIRWNFGERMAEEFLVPYSLKLWTVRPGVMNCAWLAGRVVAPRYQEVIRGAREENPHQHGLNTGFWYPLKGGIGALPAALAKRVQGNIQLQASVTKIDTRRRLVIINRTQECGYDRIISTLPLPELVALIDAVPARIQQAARNLQYNSVLCVTLGIERPAISPRHWIYYHDSEYCFNRISLPMNLSPRTVPGRASSICAEITYSSTKPLDRRRLIDRVVRELRDTGILNSTDNVLVKNTLCLPYAYVIYDQEHRRNVDLIHDYLLRQGIVPAGRFGEWEYFNMDKTLLSGKKAAKRLIHG